MRIALYCRCLDADGQTFDNIGIPMDIQYLALSEM
jgi:hypothetical protein